MWILLALAAASFQTARNGLARSLSGKVSPVLNSWSRFAFNLPFSALLAGGLVALSGAPQLPVAFFVYCFGTATTQLLANVALISAFDRANFAQSITLHKLEIVFTAFVGAWLFSEHPTPLGWAGILSCGVGVLLLNLGRTSGPAGWRRAFHLDAGALLALACAVGLVFASFWLKEATAVFAAANPRVGTGRFEAAAHTLFHTTWMEVAMLTTALVLFRRAAFSQVRLHWRRMLGIGTAGFAGSLCWFWAYAIALVAYVKAVGQVEAVGAVVLALVVWREREVWRQIPGVVMIVAGIFGVLLG